MFWKNFWMFKRLNEVRIDMEEALGEVKAGDLELTMAFPRVYHNAREIEGAA